MEHPTVVAAAEVTEENPAQDKAKASTPTRGNETTGTPPPTSAVEEEDKVPSPSLAEEERAPTPAPAEASTLEGSPSRGKGPMIPVTVAGGSAEGEEAQAASDDEVEEIQGRPHDGWRSADSRSCRNFSDSSNSRADRWWSCSNSHRTARASRNRHRREDPRPGKRC